MSTPVENTGEYSRQAASDLVSWLCAIKRQDRRAFEQLYDATIRQIYGLALRITRQQELAEEVISDVYLQVWQRAGSYSAKRGTVMAWLSILCRSRALDALRKDNSAIRQLTSNEQTVPDQPHGSEPPDLLQSIEQGTAIHAALNQLSGQQRQLIALAYFSGYTHSELAGFLDIPIGTVKTRLRRAMLELKTLIGNSMEIGLLPNA